MHGHVHGNRFATELYPRRLHELEEEFAVLAARIPESPEKQALSVLHGITQELWRNLRQQGAPLSERGSTSRTLSTFTGTPQRWKARR